VTLTRGHQRSTDLPAYPHSPLGVAIGLGVRESFNANGAAMAGTSGVLDAFSAGILLYTGLVEVSLYRVCAQVAVRLLICQPFLTSCSVMKSSSTPE
jgi:hypothetical protein